MKGKGERGKGKGEKGERGKVKGGKGERETGNQ